MADTPFLTITALDIDRWAGTTGARAVLPVLIRRLAHESCMLSAADFPGYDEAQRPGWDGWTTAPTGNAWIAARATGWELSASVDNPGKPNRDWGSRITLPADERATITFSFVTARRWPGKDNWAIARRAEGAWADVRAYDAENLAQWLERAPATLLWFAGELGRSVEHVRTLDRAWDDWSSACRPALSAMLFDDAVAAHAATFAAWRAEPPNRPFVVTADSVGEALAFVACAVSADDREWALVIDGPQPWPAVLASAPAGLIVIADAGAEAVAAASADRQRLIFAQTHATVPLDADVTLAPLDRQRFEAALAAMGIAENARDRLTTEAGRSPTILRRRLAIAPALRAPEWVRDPVLQRRLMPILLAGAWQQGDEADEACVAELAGELIERVERDLATLLALPDPPVWAAGGYRGTVSRKDALFAIHAAITGQDLDRFFTVAELVLTLDDPRLDLPADQRWAAGMYGVQMEVSAPLREAVGEMLVLLAIEGDRLLAARLGPIATRVDRVVAAVLRGATPRQWLSQHHLRWLAEASPDAFLDAVEADLRQDEPALLALMRPVASTFGTCDRTELLWALELLAWDPRRFPRVFAILARLSEVRIDDNWSNKPEASLQSLVRWWLPQTLASVDDRIAVVRRLAATRSPVAWRLLLAPFTDHGLVTENARPRWREVGAGVDDEAPQRDIATYADAMIGLLIQWGDYSVDQLADLLGVIPELPDDAVAAILDRAEDWSDHAADADRATLREHLRCDHRMWQPRDDGEVLSWTDRIRNVMRRLEPTDVVHRHQWLFAEDWVPEAADTAEGDLDRYEASIRENRTAALREVIAARGEDGVAALIAGGNAAGITGRLLADVDAERTEFWIRDVLARSDLGSAADTALGGLIASCQAEDRSALLKRLLNGRGLSVADKLRVAIASPFESSTWRILAELEPQLTGEYWLKAVGSAFNLSSYDTAFMLDRLLEVGRPFAAFRAIGAIVDRIDPSLLARVVGAMAASQGDDIAKVQPDGWRLKRSIERLARERAMTVSQLAHVEFSLYPLLGRSDGRTPNLDRMVTETPGDFVQLLTLAYKREDGQADNRQFNKESARTAWSVFRELRRIPGASDNGAINDAALVTWIDAVRRLAGDVARSNSADYVIGTLLAVSPKDPDGHWPHQAVRRALDHVATDRCTDGFVTGKCNLRGVVRRLAGGDQERALAATFRLDADAIRLAAPTAARALDRLAAAYDHEARSWDGEDQVDRRLGRR